jgi:benzoyl-CoA 2,3-dioxygenase component A
VALSGPFGSTFLMPDDPQAHCVMICTGTGSAPFRGFTMHRQRTMPKSQGSLTLIFGARTPDSLPYFGPLKKVPESFMAKHFAFSRVAGQAKQYVQDKMREQHEALADKLRDPRTHLYVCGLKAMDSGVEQALEDVARQHGLNWQEIRAQMRAEGRYHVETY